MKRYLTNWFGALGVLGLLFWASAVWAAQVPIPVPVLTGAVTDVAGVLSAQQRQTLEERLAQLAASGPGRDVRVVVVAGTQPESIEAYTQRVVQQAQAGNAVLIVVAVEDRKMRIEVPRALSPVISDAAAQSVIDQQLKPAFRDSRFADGLLAGVGRIHGMFDPIANPPVPWLIAGLIWVGGLFKVMGMFGRKWGPPAAMGLGAFGGMYMLADPVLAMGAAAVTAGAAMTIGLTPAMQAAEWFEEHFQSSGGSGGSDSSSSSSSGGGGGASGGW